MTDLEALKARLREVESSRPDIIGISTHWHRNPEGPEAADAIERLEADLAQRDAELAASQEVLGEQLAIRQRLEAEVARLREANGILEDGLQEVGDDYPGSSCQEWCQHQIKQARAALEKHHD